MEDHSYDRVRSLGRKRKLILLGLVFGLGLTLLLRVFSFFSPSILSDFTSSVSPFLGSATFLFILAIASVSVVIMFGKVRAPNCYRLRALFLPRKRTEALILSVSGDECALLTNNGGHKHNGFAVSMLRLLSVPSEGVRQRVRGAVARDEQEEGAAVSNEKQYQFSHIESLSRSDEPHGCMAYEIQFSRGLVKVGFTVSAEDPMHCRSKRERVKSNVLSKFPIQLVEVSGKDLKDSVLMSLPSGVYHVEAAGDKLARVSNQHFSGYVAVVALSGRPEMSAHEQRCQIDQFITGVNSAIKYRYQGDETEQLGVTLVVSFEASTPPKYPSDASLRERLREKPDVRLSLKRKRIEVDAMEVEFGHRVGWWKVSAYGVVIGRDRVPVEEKADSVANVMRSVWSGSHFSPDCMFLHSREVVKFLPVILRRGLLAKRYVTEMSSIRLSSLVHIPEEPHPPLSKGTPPPFEVPDPTNFLLDTNVRVALGDVLSSVGEVLYPLTLPIDALGTHMSVFGESGRGKTCFILNLLWKLVGEDGDCVEDERIPFLVLDQKGEYRCLISRPEYGVAYFLPASDLAPLKINLFDPQGDDAESHSKRVFNIIREILFANRTELTPQMERVLYDVLRMNVGGDWSSFNNNLTKYLEVHGDELPQLGATAQGILNRVGQFTRPPLSYVFDCKESNVNFNYLVQRRAVIDLSELRRLGTPEDVRLIGNIIGKYVSVASLNRGSRFGGGLKHLFIVDDALDVVPEVLAKKTTADVGTIEYMAMLLRATGQGLVVVSQRPNIAENVISNSGVKVFFRTVVDWREVTNWANLSEEQAAYLKVLPKQEAIITVPQYSAPMRIRIPDVSSLAARKVTDQQVIENNMITYPVMYDMQTQRKEEAHRTEPAAKMGNMQEECITSEETRKEKVEGKENAEEFVQQREQGTMEEDNEPAKLAPEWREAWSKVRDYLTRGFVVDSDFVSKILDVSQPAAHRKMLYLKSAGLVGVAKVPNYAYGEGYQYVYYSPNRTVYGGGVVGYVRERIHDDLVGRETVVSVSPKDVPSADMVVQNSYPLIIHMTSSGPKEGSRLSALKERIRKVAEEFGMSNGLRVGGCAEVDADQVIVVTLWKKVTKELNEARRQGKLNRCLCVIPFNEKSVDMLADYVLHHITLKTLQGEGEKEEEKGAAGNDDEKREEVREAGTQAERGNGIIEEDAKSRKRKERETSKGNLKEGVQVLVRDLGGVEPRIIAERLGVPLPRISEAAAMLKEQGAIKVVRNLPYLASLRKSNATYYLDALKPTALHDTLMNEIWKSNIDLGGRSRDYAFEHEGKTWNTDGLLDNSGGRFILEVMTGEQGEGSSLEHVLDKIGAYSTQIGYNGIRGVVVVVLEQMYAERLRKEIVFAAKRVNSEKEMVGDVHGKKSAESGVASVFVSTLRRSEEKLELESLLLHGDATSYHKNLRLRSSVAG